MAATPTRPAGPSILARQGEQMNATNELQDDINFLYTKNKVDSSLTHINTKISKLMEEEESLQSRINRLSIDDQKEE